MKIPKNKFITNHNFSSSNNNKYILPKIFYMTTNNRTVTIAAAITILMQAIVSVNTTHNVMFLQPDTDMTTAATTEIKIWTKNQFDINKNTVIIRKQQHLQQQLYQSTKTKNQQTQLQSPMPPIPLESFSLNPYHLSDVDTTETLAQSSSPTVANKYTTRTISGRAGSNGECKSLTAAWGDVDPNIFYICDTQTNKPLQLRCPEGRGFFLGLGFSGCIPYEQWPACISSGHHEQVAICDTKHMQQPRETMNPNKFYVCLKESFEPTILSCETGKGFVHAVATTSGGGTSSAATKEGIYSEIIGCANWKKWRNYMQCNGYY